MVDEDFTFKLIDENESDYDSLGFKDYISELQEMNVLFEENIDNDFSKDESLKSEFIFLDMTINQLLLISKVVEWFESNNVNFLWSKKQSSKTSGLGEIKTLTYNLSNTLWTIKFLLSKGIDHQAKILFRYFIEQYDILIAIAGDYDFFIKYSERVSNDDPYEDFNEKWYRHIRPKKIKPIIERISNDILNDKRLGKLLKYYKETNYEWLSLYSHGHGLTLQIASLVLDENGEFIENKHCNYDFKIIYTIEKLILHSGFVTIAVIDLLNKFHKLDSYLDTEMRKEWIRKEIIYRSIFMKNMIGLVEKNFE